MSTDQAQQRGRSSLLPLPSRHRVFILTDITNEPDDAESFCRYLTYANQFRTEGIVAVTSTWLRDRVAPENLHQIVDAYEKVVQNLNAHVHPDSPYPSADEIRGLIRAGPPVYGMEAVGDDVPLSEGGELLLQCLTAPAAADDPLWVLVWGGVNVLAQVLHRTRHRPDAAEVRSRLRVYTISDQDDCGAWIRQQWPEIFYISSVHGWNQYGCAAWPGISGDGPGEQGGPDGSKITAEWVRKNIQVGPLGAEYPDFEFIIEGDTPTFLYLIRNGLGVPEQPSYGSWGGRYLPVNVGSSRSPLTAGWGHHSDVTDAVVGVDGREHRSNKATIWRWRNAFQDDFAARMQWTLTSDFAACNHHPVICVDGSVGSEPVWLETDAGGTVTLDASGTYDPDGDELTFRWFQYREPSATQTFHPFEVSDLTIEPAADGHDDDGSRVKVTIAPAHKSCMRVRDKIPIERGLLLHLILEVVDKGTPPLTSYRRIMIQPVDRNFKAPRAD